MREMPPQLQTSEKNRIRQLLRRDDNLDQLLYLICLYIQDSIFPISVGVDSVIKLALIRRLGQELRNAIIAKLKQYFPKDRNRGDDALLKYHPDRGGELLQQALSHLVDLWVQDKVGPKDTIVTKCQRLLPLLSSLPDLRGKSALGKTSLLLGLVVYDDAKTLLQKLPRAKQTLIEDDKSQRKRVFSSIMLDLQAGNTGLSPPPSSILTDAFRIAAKNDYMDWMLLSRTGIALDIVAKAIGQTPDYFLHSVKKLRDRAEMVNRFLNLSL